MIKKTLLPLSTVAVALLAFASPSHGAILNLENGPNFTPEAAFTNNTIVANTTVSGGLIDLQGSATVTPVANTVSIDLSGSYGAEAGEKFSVAYSFTVDLNIPEPVGFTIAGTLDVGGTPVPVMASGTLMPGLHKYEGALQSSPFPAPAAGNFTASFAFDFTSTGSALLEAMPGTLDLSIQQVDFKLGTVAATVLPPSTPQNLSTRGNVGAGEDVLIGGFIITGNDDKEVVLRGIGPSIPSSEVMNSLADPTIELVDSTGATVATNDNWRDLSANDQTVLTDNNLAPGNDAESALVETLSPGEYTVIVRGANDSTGVALVEAYDLDNGTTDSKLANISTRSNVTTDEGVMIGGFIVGGGGFSEIIVRGLGPSLADQGITDFLADPQLELHDADGNVIDSNDNWMDGSGMQQISDDQLAPSDPKEAALFEILPAGMYTAVLSGVNSTTGVALVEVYNIDGATPPAAK